jgi:IS605 OrfB family transposase
MAEMTKTMKLHIHPDEAGVALLKELTVKYSCACNYVSEYVFDHGFILNFMELQKALYNDVRRECGLKSQFTISSLKTVTARYKTIRTQLAKKPYKYQNGNGDWQFIPSTLEWLTKPVSFRRPQADLVRGRDYSFVNGASGEKLLSLNTLGGRIKVTFDIPDCFEEYFDGSWSFGTGKIVSLLGEWYFHIPVTKTTDEELTPDNVKHVVGLDRGLRFIVTGYDEGGNTTFISGKDVIAKRDRFQKVRDELQAKGTKSAKRALKRISGRENRWISDVNHQISKTLVDRYGSGTLFAVEDLAGVSFSEENLSNRTKKQRKDLRTWSFYQLEQFLTYKAEAVGSEVLEVKPDYTSQRCPKCGRILKANRHHEIHEYICDCCGYRSNDDRVGAMNIQLLGTMYLSGDMHPRFGARKEK